ncbi:MAG: inorganic phosphate transporter [Candidatus Micrarchaeia archaeon]
MIETLFAFILSFILIMLVSGNNLPACSGSVIGSKIVSKKTGVSITIIGYALGLILEGGMLRRGVNAIFPYRFEPLLIVALFTAIVVFLIAHKMRVPQSLAVNFTGILVGVSLAMHFSIGWGFVMLMVLFWVAAPVASILLIAPLMNLSHSIVNGKKIWRSIKRIKLVLIFLSFFSAFALGANTIGLVYSSMPNNSFAMIAALLGILIGSIFLNGGELRRISSDIISMRYLNSINSQFVSVILVEIATFLGIPLSNTQTFVASVYGTGLSYKNRIILKKPAIAIAFTWIGGAVVSLLLSYAITSLFL